jgi:predicted GIY-YIG superfamily endonuclease
MFYVYMLRRSERVAQHESGAISSCYTFDRRPIHLVYSQDFVTRDEAITMERRIKGWNRAKKTALINGDWKEISRISRFKYGKSRSPSTSSGRTE